MNITGTFVVELGSYSKTAIYNFGGAFTEGAHSSTNLSRQISSEAGTPWKSTMAFDASKTWTGETIFLVFFI